MRIHYHVLVNPAAGSGKGATVAKQIIALLDQHDLLYTPYYTEKSGDERFIAKRLSNGILIPFDETKKYEDTPFPLLLIIGGDGTVDEVVNEFYLNELVLPVSYIPAGSGNDFARGIGLPLDPEKAFWQVINAPHPQQINVLAYDEKVSQRRGVVLNNLGIGIDAAIVNSANLSASKKHLNKFQLGSLSYIVYILKAVFTQQPFPILVEINGESYEFDRTFLCVTTNIPYFGCGVAIAPMASPRKANLDLVIIEKPNLLALVRFLLQLVRKKHTKNKHYKHFSSSKLRIVSTVPQYAQGDGEILGREGYDVFFSTTNQLIWF